MTAATLIPVPEQARQILTALFEPDDIVAFRPIETWNEGGKKKQRVLFKQCRWIAATKLTGPTATWQAWICAVERERGNVFFGVCPRFNQENFDEAWQVRKVRVLWADLDHCTVEEARERCRSAKLPDPSIVVASGHGVHLYWLLVAVYLIDDVDDPLPIQKEFIDQGHGKKKKVVKFLVDPKGKRIEEDDFQAVSAKGQRIQAILAGISATIGGDHTQDLSRLLRVPGTMNRKNERNHKPPTPCVLVECNPDRRYPLSAFEGFMGVAVATAKPANVEAVKIKLRSGVKFTQTRRNKLADLLNICAVAEDRSKADYALCAWAVETGLNKEEVWVEAKHVGKFADRGRSYFDLTWQSAENATRQNVYDRACRKAGRTAHKGGAAPTQTNGVGSNGHADGAAPFTSATRPIIEITVEEHVVNDQAVRALTADPSIYQRGGELVFIVREPEQEIGGIRRPAGTPRIARMPAPVVRERMAAAAQWMGVDDKGELVPRHPPDWSVSAVANRGEWPGIRRLDGVVDCPVLRPDGTILANPGYDPATGLVYEPSIEVPVIPEQLFKEDADEARDALLEVVCDYPFAKEEHKATWLAGLLTPLARPAFEGPSPLFLVDSNIRGSGKGLLNDITATITTGRAMPVMSCPRDDEEFRKRITSSAIAGDQLVNIDNIAGALGCASLDAALTATVWRDRVLGKSEMTTLPMRSVWFATGNNVVLLADTARRTAHIRIESKEEHPEERKGFKHPDLRTWVIQNRGRLLCAALTVLRGYCADGRPDMQLKPWGSYEGWSNLVRSAVVWCGLKDPGSTRTDVRERCDQEAGLLKAIIAALPKLDTENKGLKASDIREKVTTANLLTVPEVASLREALLMTIAAKAGDFPSSRQIGMKLRHLEGRVVGGKCLLGKPDGYGTNLWFVSGT